MPNSKVKVWWYSPFFFLWTKVILLTAGLVDIFHSSVLSFIVYSLISFYLFYPGKVVLFLCFAVSCTLILFLCYIFCRVDISAPHLLCLLHPPSVPLTCRDVLLYNSPSCQWLCVQFQFQLSCFNWMKDCVVFNSAVCVKLVFSNEAQQSRSSRDARRHQLEEKHEAELLLRVFNQPVWTLSITLLLCVLYVLFLYISFIVAILKLHNELMHIV